VIGAEAGVIAALAEDVAPDGDIVVVDRSVDRLESLRHASKEPDVTYLVGESEVLPLTDQSVDLVWSAETPEAGTASEFFRVLRRGGQVSLRGTAGSALNLGERMLSEAGFVEITAVSTDDGAALAARKP
jgi:ubiquinone/menaquinone biosynthesis C-methylase UbiE